jgi:hypothetical protein
VAALLYHYWNNEQAEAWKDLRVPVVLSIATFRHWDKNTPIYVVDVSDEERQWADFPSFLNFKVVRAEYHLKHVVRPEHERSAVRMLSKPNDIYSFSLTVPERVILCVDADYFFVKNPCPIRHGPDQPPTIGWNTGYWKYNKVCPLTVAVFDLWKSSCANVLLDDVFRESVMQVSGRTHLNDETMMNVLSKKHPGITIPPSSWDNVTFDSLVTRRLDAAQVRGLHVIFASLRIARQQRGLVCLYVKELRELI